MLSFSDIDYNISAFFFNKESCSFPEKNIFYYFNELLIYGIFFAFILLGLRGKRYFKYAAIMIIFGYIVPEYVFKQPFSRPRPVEITEFCGDSDYQDFYQINNGGIYAFKSEQHNSFISRHSTIAAILLFFAVIYKKYRKLAIFIWLYTSFMRIYVGKHFFFDVITPLFYIFFIFYLAYFYFKARL